MFGLLKNKLSNFIKGLTGKEGKAAPAAEEKTVEKQPEAPIAEKPGEKISAKEPEMKTSVIAAKPAEKPSAKTEAKPPEKIREKPAEKAEKKPVHAPLEKPAEKIKPLPVAKPAEKTAPEIAEKPAEKINSEAKPIQAAFEKQQAKQPEKPMAKAEPPVSPAPKAGQAQGQQKKSIVDSFAGIFSHKPAQQEAKSEPDISRLEKKAAEESRAMAPKIGIGASIKSIFANEITIGEGEVSGLLEELELSLLEADVAYEVSLQVTEELRKKLVGMKVPKGEVESRTREAVMRVLESVMASDRKFDMVARAKSMPKPVKMLFIGPNGAGKTTTIAKVARMLMDSGLTVVLSASDTFRAAAIEQTEVHAGRLGVKAIKSKYGADPSSVAFDAINYASSHSIDVVLIDSAGRQDTNANLLLELKKMVRVAKPDLKIYIGESIGGNAVVEQIRTFNELIGIDGAILTKIDCDAKGGTAISVARATGIPVLYLGVGQNYSDLVPFDPHRIAQEIMT